MKATVTTQRTFEGCQFSLRPGGWARFFEAVPLALWLTFWAVGEGAVILILGAGAWTLITGQPAGIPGLPLEPISTLGTAGFLCLWLTFWTLGGVMAMRELLRLLWAEDRLIARPDGLRVVHRIGPFRRTRDIARKELRGVYRIANGSCLMAEVVRGSVELTRLGDRDTLEGIEMSLRRELQLVADSPSARRWAIPDGWAVATTGAGERVAIKCPVRRKREAAVMWVLAMAAAAVVAWVRLRYGAGARLGVGMVLAMALPMLMALGAASLSFWHYEWVLLPGRLVLRSRVGSRVRRLFDASVLELSKTADSDGDDWFTLAAVAPVEGARGAGTERKRRTLMKRVNDPTEPRLLGAWLAQESGVVLDDQALAETPPVDLAAVRARLENQGRFGRVLARGVGAIAPQDKRSS